MTAIPAYSRTWIQNLTSGVPGTRISYVSLNDLMQNFVYGAKTFLLANGYTVKWTSNGTTGPTSSSDTTDRITNAAAWGTLGANAASAQAWMVLIDGNGAQMLWAWQGSSADVLRVSFSPGALFTLAGTSTNQPTATDECVLWSASMVGTATSGDRVWHGLVSNDAKACRFAIFRASTIVSPVFGLGNFTAGVSAPASIPVPVWGFAWSFNRLTATQTSFFSGYAANTAGGLCRATVSSVGYTVQISPCTWFGGGSGQPLPNSFNYQPELQGGGYIPWPVMLIATAPTGARGFVGTPFDFWVSEPTGYVVGDGFGTSYDWIQMGCFLWPNPSAVAPTIT